MLVIEQIKEYFKAIINTISVNNTDKVLAYLKQIPLLCDMDDTSKSNRVLRDTDPKHFHPIKTFRGEIYNANITENVGSELGENHLVVIIQGKTSNLFGEKVTVLPIEGEGGRIDPKYQIELTNDDLEYGHLNKNPSRIIFTDITTIDKARLKRKIGKVNPTKMNKISSRVSKHLELNNLSNRTNVLDWHMCRIWYNEDVKNSYQALKWALASAFSSGNVQ